MAQHWSRVGLVWQPPKAHPWIASHAQIPTLFVTGEGVLRVYLGTRDSQNRTMTILVDCDASSPDRVLDVHDAPLLPLGKPGTFDDCGVMPSCAIARKGSVLLYYIGWNTSLTVPYRNSIGVAVSEDGGRTFNRISEGPVLDRGTSDPYFVATPFVTEDQGRLRMWYLSATSWRPIDGRMEPSYTIRHAESSDGICWRPSGIDCVSCGDEEAICRPWVIRGPTLYHMWYCYRSLRQYRDDARRSYRIGYATSTDGVRFERRDGDIEISGGSGEWDAGMQAYPALYKHGDRYYLFYNGNRFGTEGFGYATSSLALE